MKLIKHPQHRPLPRPTGIFDDSFWDEPFGMIPAFFGNKPWTTGLSVDVSETDDALIFEADVPGYDPKDINVEIDHDTVTISGKMSEETEEKEKKYYRRERRSGEFTREFVLPNYVEADQAKCQIKNGTLTITVPKKKGVAKKSLKVEEA